jgi:hypothetical protein
MLGLDLAHLPAQAEQIAFRGRDAVLADPRAAVDPANRTTPGLA